MTVARTVYERFNENPENTCLMFACNDFFHRYRIGERLLKMESRPVLAGRRGPPIVTFAARRADSTAERNYAQPRREDVGRAKCGLRRPRPSHAVHDRSRIALQGSDTGARPSRTIKVARRLCSLARKWLRAVRNAHASACALAVREATPATESRMRSATWPIASAVGAAAFFSRNVRSQ